MQIALAIIVRLKAVHVLMLMKSLIANVANQQFIFRNTLQIKISDATI